MAAAGQPTVKFAGMIPGSVHLPGVIEFVEEEVDWQSPVTRTHPPEIPWSSIRRTKQEVAAFFKELGQNVKPEGFELFQRRRGGIIDIIDQFAGRLADTFECKHRPDQAYRGQVLLIFEEEFQCRIAGVNIEFGISWLRGRSAAAGGRECAEQAEYENIFQSRVHTIAC